MLPEIKKKKAVSPMDNRPFPKRAEGQVFQVSRDQSVCAGCGTCELMCALVHKTDEDSASQVGPVHQRIWIDRNEFEGYPTVLPCHQCDSPECYFACPTGALQIHSVTNARFIDETKCVGCLSCREACAYAPPRINYDPDRDKALKCDLCSNRTEGPACVEFCPQKAIVLNPKEAYHEK